MQSRTATAAAVLALAALASGAALAQAALVRGCVAALRGEPRSAQAFLDAAQRTSPLVRVSAAAGYSGRAGRRPRVAALCVVCKSGGVTVDRSAPN